MSKGLEKFVQFGKNFSPGGWGSCQDGKNQKNGADIKIPQAAGYRRGKSRYGIVRDTFAGYAAMSQIKFEARPARR